MVHVFLTKTSIYVMFKRNVILFKCNDLTIRVEKNKN